MRAPFPLARGAEGASVVKRGALGRRQRRRAERRAEEAIGPMLWRQKEHRDDEEDKDKPLSAWGHQSRCGSVGKATKLDVGEPKKGKRPARIGLWKCNERECR